MDTEQKVANQQKQAAIELLWRYMAEAVSFKDIEEIKAIVAEIDELNQEK